MASPGLGLPSLARRGWRGRVDAVPFQPRRPTGSRLAFGRSCGEAGAGRALGGSDEVRCILRWYVFLGPS